MKDIRKFDFKCDFEVLYLSVMDNIDYFYSVRHKYWYAVKFVSSLRELLSHLHWYERNLTELNNEAQYYDFCGAEGNGFRSFILIFERCFNECYDFSKSLVSVRSSYFFRANNFIKSTESLLSIFDGLRPGLKYINKILNENKYNHSLMADAFLTAEELIRECGTIRQLGFYGRHQGFYVSILICTLSMNFLYSITCSETKLCTVL